MPVEDEYGDDQEHPIPRVDAIDVHSVWKTGGSDLNIVIASPLLGDGRSMNRLLRKLQLYLQFIGSTDYDTQCGPPAPERTTIVVNVHPESDKVVFEALEQCGPWVASNRATLKVVQLEVPE